MYNISYFRVLSNLFYKFILIYVYNKNIERCIFMKKYWKMIHEIPYNTTIKWYAQEKQIDWRTAKKRLVEKKLICFSFRWKKVYIEKKDLIDFILKNFVW